MLVSANGDSVFEERNSKDMLVVIGFAWFHKELYC